MVWAPWCCEDETTQRRRLLALETRASDLAQENTDLRHTIGLRDARIAELQTASGQLNRELLTLKTAHQAERRRLGFRTRRLARQTAILVFTRSPRTLRLARPANSVDSVRRPRHRGNGRLPRILYRRGKILDFHP